MPRRPPCRILLGKNALEGRGEEEVEQAQVHHKAESSKGIWVTCSGEILAFKLSVTDGYD